MKQATIAYVNKLMCGITTAGDDPVSPCAQRVEMCRKILRGLINNDRIFIFMCSMDKSESGDVDILNQWQHQKSNPNYGVTVRPEEIMAAAQEAINDPQMRKEFLTRRGNIFVSSLRAYFDLDMFRASNRIAEQKLGIDASWTIEQKINHLSKIPRLHWYGGADLSKLHDLTASALYASVNEEIAVIIPHCWFPIVAAHEKADQDNIPLFGWQDDGWLDMVNAPTNNHKLVVDWFVDMKKRGFRITEIGIDRKFAEQFFVGLKEKGFRAEDQPQFYHLKTVGFRAIETAARNNNLYYLGAEPFEYCVSNVQAIEKTDDMIIFDKINPTQRIDVFDAAVFAACKAMKSYERRVKSGS
jgi:phage terminase large subunit-like protein